MQITIEAPSNPAPEHISVAKSGAERQASYLARQAKLLADLKAENARYASSLLRLSEALGSSQDLLQINTMEVCSLDPMTCCEKLIYAIERDTAEHLVSNSNYGEDV